MKSVIASRTVFPFLSVCKSLRYRCCVLALRQICHEDPSLARLVTTFIHFRKKRNQHHLHQFDLWLSSQGSMHPIQTSSNNRCQYASPHQGWKQLQCAVQCQTLITHTDMWFLCLCMNHLDTDQLLLPA